VRDSKRDRDGGNERKRINATISVRVKEKGKKSTKKVNEHDIGSERLKG